MRYHWEPSEGSYRLLEGAVLALKLLGGVIVAVALLGAILIAANSSSGSSDAERLGAAIGVAIGGVFYGTMTMLGGAVLDVYLGIASIASRGQDDDEE